MKTRATRDNNKEEEDKEKSEEEGIYCGHHGDDEDDNDDGGGRCDTTMNEGFMYSSYWEECECANVDDIL